MAGFHDTVVLVNIGWLIVPLFAFAVVATGNAVNISDGMDGLAGGEFAQY